MTTFAAATLIRTLFSFSEVNRALYIVNSSTEDKNKWALQVVVVSHIPAVYVASKPRVDHGK